MNTSSTRLNLFPTAAAPVPGVLAALSLALLAGYLSSLVPHRLVSGGVFALLIGMALHPVVRRLPWLKGGISFTSRRLLRAAIVCMGVTLSLPQVMQVGAVSLLVMAFTLATAFGGGWLLGRLLGMNWKLSGLISAGTGICGGSAIAAIAPVIDAEPHDIAYALSATFIFDVVMVVLFPLMGRHLGLSDLGFGLWAGTAVNDTSSVVAAGYAFSETAGNLAIVVKLTRTLAVVPAVLLFSVVRMRMDRIAVSADPRSRSGRFSFAAIFPWFIAAFLAVVAVNSMNLVTAQAAERIASAGRLLMVMALGAVGMKTDTARLARSGLVPMLHGFIISAAVVIVSLLVQVALHQV